MIRIPGSVRGQCLGDGRCADGVTRHLLADYGVPHQETVDDVRSCAFGRVGQQWHLAVTNIDNVTRKLTT